MSANFDRFEQEIRHCLLLKDLHYFKSAFQDLFSFETQALLSECSQETKVDNFLREFKNITTPAKFEILKNCAKEYNRWIYSFLTVDIHDVDEVRTLLVRRLVLSNLLDLLRHSRDTLCVMSTGIINEIGHREIITMANRDFLLQSFEKNGAVTAMFELFDVISARDENWYGKILCLISRKKTDFNAIMCEELKLEDGISITEKEEKIMEYSLRLVERQIDRFMEEGQDKSSKSKKENMDDDKDEDYGSYEDEMSNDGAAGSTATPEVDQCYADSEFDFGALLNTEEDKLVQLRMKDYQLELAELALKGENVIVYAPTGIGKTIVAIYIANEHLKSNPNGKIAFLVPRKHLVTQQYAAFEKFKDENLKVIELHSKAESSCGPLISHLDNFNVFVMTGGILHNALTIDDGNKISSISKFSLIFFDECHHCLKLDPYSRVMSEYIREKLQNKCSKLPQIVGLTASPRSNNSNNIVGMKKSILELCANLDTVNFAFVRNHVKELEQDIVTPVQEVERVGQRQFNDFEASLIGLMTICEEKLLKMKKERYFSQNFFKSIPGDKFNQNYILFIGKLKKLNNDTIEANDGKQKAYSIYRYLNAFYRGLIVHQLFNEFYAKECIDRHLSHDGETFTCCYDEEFSAAYKGKIVVREESNNPGIEKIKYYVQEQLREKPDSRILIFVQQVDYTNYLMDLFRKSTNIEIEALFGSNPKNDQKGCSKSDSQLILDRFKSGDIQVIVATSVVEEGLDVPDCNMVISYGYVTDETALIQRLGRARSVDSRYILILPPMFYWMEKKEENNRRRSLTMMKLIHDYKDMEFDTPEMKKNIYEHQRKLFQQCNKVGSMSTTNKESWTFKCRSCQRFICTSEELRFLEKSHVIVINPKLLKTLVTSNTKEKSYGSMGTYMIQCSIKCPCLNQKLGHFVYYRGTPYTQLRINFCSISSVSRTTYFAKWKDFTQICNIPLISADELEDYQSRLVV